MCTLVLNWNGICPFTNVAGTFGNMALGVLGGHSGAGLAPVLPQMVLSTKYDGGTSPLPTLMPPDSVPAFAEIRLLAICRLWFQPCMKMPPPPCELLMMLKPSMLDGLQRKLVEP